MTRRERLERKLEKRAEWAEKAQVRAEVRFDAARALADQIPLGQPRQGSSALRTRPLSAFVTRKLGLGLPPGRRTVRGRG